MFFTSSPEMRTRAKRPVNMWVSDMKSSLFVTRGAVYFVFAKEQKPIKGVSERPWKNSFSCQNFVKSHPALEVRGLVIIMAEAFAKPSRSLLGGFSKPSAPATSS